MLMCSSSRIPKSILEILQHNSIHKSEIFLMPEKKKITRIAIKLFHAHPPKKGEIFKYLFLPTSSFRSTFSALASIQNKIAWLRSFPSFLRSYSCMRSVSGGILWVFRPPPNPSTNFSNEWSWRIFAQHFHDENILLVKLARVTRWSRLIDAPACLVNHMTDEMNNMRKM